MRPNSLRFIVNFTFFVEDIKSLAVSVEAQGIDFGLALHAAQVFNIKDPNSNKLSAGRHQ